ncbi:MAG: tRNA (N6-isopentenyl adenosine(37)-C2)-methylthiotransferase MiaB [Buchnera aphidicola (Periphyllus lyropictus)]|uniref:tRNA (N6-isopentenyl adenosine(37)-C2)-methylthiotransferase MiaB n=1 Tax=Buchnera aphidicola TaxID=9 RepID=UPI001ECAB870|nr:tRNA (N6-isopentenyl adenosine(37)-C2)-methylthiotransferase MiaB [Buchnera aphidicola]NIH16540.1 tRNA (N6-isopentenyl adenosine(37)-C2)-methylthiotransferase MiaB [Buchnera aphidicola (Periphyllus lyropictus)]USS94433.1 tRNA (N6-isopentenyl adenosine(37)-C2)-methylthiotransferase MiaB [Buchnera aphidicola (Periphyllus lyropictus)]
MKKIHIKTWGCQMNEYDSSIISKVLKKKLNYHITNNFKKADILILNTCSIREKAQEKIFHQLGRWKYLKKKNKEIIIAVGGCVSTQEKKKIFKRANFIDIIFGPKTIHRLPKMIKKLKKKKKKIINIKSNNLNKFKFFKYNTIKKVSSFISIMEGCNKCCSFCIVPYTRGKEISRFPKDILSEAKYLSKNGTKEIILLGQNVNSYKSKFSDGSICTFSKLIKLLSKIKKILRIRFTTSNPMEFSDDLIKTYKNTTKLVSYLHLPVQSGSNKILKKMRRSYNIKKYKEIIKKLIKIRPKIQITSDFIVGFPGESKKDFHKTLKLIDEINFDMSFSFIYSPRPKTPASRLLDETQLKEKKKRLYLLQKKINKNTNLFSKKMIGTYQKVLVEKKIYKNNKKYFFGKTYNNRTVIFKSSKNLIGKLIYVKIYKAHMQNLKGKI